MPTVCFVCLLFCEGFSPGSIKFATKSISELSAYRFQWILENCVFVKGLVMVILFPALLEAVPQIFYGLVISRLGMKSLVNFMSGSNEGFEEAKQ